MSPLAGRLRQAGVICEILPIDARVRDLRKDTVLSGRPRAGAALGTLAYTARLAWRLRALRPDLVHTNSLKSGIYGSLAARLAGIPVVWHLRDRISDDYLPPGAVRLLRALIGRLADAVIANSHATLATLGDGALRLPHRVIGDSVEVSPHARTGGAFGGTFGMLGRIAPWKGQDLFLRAFAEAFPEGSERAVIVGTPMFGEQAYERHVRELAGQLGLGERVEFRGFREDVWRELAGFDVLVHASVTAEPFGQVVLEGMAAGLPVIAPDEGGPAELIRDRATGWLFRSRDRTSLATAMRRLAGDRAQREQLGARAQQAVDSYHPSVLARQYESVYDSVRAAQAEPLARARHVNERPAPPARVKRANRSADSAGGRTRSPLPSAGRPFARAPWPMSLIP